MSEENVEIVRATYEPFARGDCSSFADWSDEFEFVTSPEQPDAGTYRGEEARRWAMNMGGGLRRANHGGHRDHRRR